MLHQSDVRPFPRTQNQEVTLLHAHQLPERTFDRIEPDRFVKSARMHHSRNYFTESCSELIKYINCKYKKCSGEAGDKNEECANQLNMLVN